MTDLPTGAYAPDPYQGGETSRTKQVAEQGAQAAGHAATDVKDTAAEQVQHPSFQTSLRAVPEPLLQSLVDEFEPALAQRQKNEVE